MSECVQCGKEIKGDCWHLGECIIGGGLFAYSSACAIAAADKLCRSGTQVEECVVNTAEGNDFQCQFRVIHTVK